MSLPASAGGFDIIGEFLGGVARTAGSREMGAALTGAAFACAAAKDRQRCIERQSNQIARSVPRAVNRRYERELGQTSYSFSTRRVMLPDGTVIPEAVVETKRGRRDVSGYNSGISGNW